MAEFNRNITIAGYKVRLRLIQPSDAPLLVDLFHQLSSHTIWLRFHQQAERFTEEQILQGATRLSDLDGQRTGAVVATLTNEHGQEEIIGVARFARVHENDTEAETAIVVRDDFQHRGLGKHLFRALAKQAKAAGVTYAFGWVRPENIYLMKFVRRMGVKVESVTEHGERKIRVAL